jgi:D-amino-acid dehydrogenase
LSSSAIVVGGGAVGLCVAEALATRGVSVTVIERDRCGRAASAGNAGWVTTSLSAPVPAPGVVGQSLRWLVDPSGPLWIRPTLSPAMLTWIATFLRCCPRRVYLRGLAALQEIAGRAPAAFDRLAERGAEFELHSQQLLYPAFSEHELGQLTTIAAELEEIRSGASLQRLTKGELIELEGAISERTIGGMVGSEERRVRPESFTAGVRTRVEGLGGSVVEQTPVVSLRRSRTGWIATGPTREWHADSLVVAAGVATQKLVRAFGVHLRIATAKGYSRTFARAPSGPSRSMYLEGPKVAISVYDGGVRVSGTLELGARGLTLSERRLRAITAAASAALPGWDMPADPADWAGMRPLSPDGLPYIGPLPGIDGFHVAAAHAMLGVTLAPITGELLGDLIADGERDPLLDAFDPGRRLGRPSAWRPAHPSGLGA